MRVRHVGLALAALVAAGGTSTGGAQTVDEWVARNPLARGGAEQLKAVQAMKLTGTLTTGGMEFPLTILLKRPNLVRQETQFEDKVAIQAFDGQRAWTVNPMMMSGDRPQVIEGPQADMMRDQAEFDGPLLDYRQRGSRIEIEGHDSVGGGKAVRLRITKKSGQVQRLWLDAERGLEVKSAVEVGQGDQRVTIETLMSDYRDVGGLMFPFALKTLVNGQVQAEMKLASIDLAPKVDPAAFAMPSR